MTESLAGRKEKQRRVGDTEKEGRREARRKEKGEDEGDGKSKVKPVTEWAGMTDWVVAGRKWRLDGSRKNPELFLYSKAEQELILRGL